MFLAIYATLATFANDLRTKAVARVEATGDRGSVTLEQAVIASALFLAAVALLAVIANAISSRAGMIS